jgi:hypothetical protein
LSHTTYRWVSMALARNNRRFWWALETAVG